jgi:hypothetical protein
VITWIKRLVRACIAYKRGTYCRQALRVGNTVYMHPADYAKLTECQRVVVSRETWGGLSIVPTPYVGPRFMRGKEAFRWVLTGGKV